MTKVHKICVDLCAYGGAGRDPTVIWTSMDTLRLLSRRCPGKCSHHKHAPPDSQFRRIRANYATRISQELRRLWAHLVLSRSHVPQTDPFVSATFCKGDEPRRACLSDVVWTSQHLYNGRGGGHFVRSKWANVTGAVSGQVSVPRAGVTTASDRDFRAQGSHPHLPLQNLGKIVTPMLYCSCWTRKHTLILSTISSTCVLGVGSVLSVFFANIFTTRELSQVIWPAQLRGKIAGKCCLRSWLSRQNQATQSSKRRK